MKYFTLLHSQHTIGNVKNIDIQSFFLTLVGLVEISLKATAVYTVRRNGCGPYTN